MDKKYKYVAKENFCHSVNGSVLFGKQSGEEIEAEYIENIPEYLYEKIELEAD